MRRDSHRERNPRWAHRTSLADQRSRSAPPGRSACTAPRQGSQARRIRLALASTQILIPLCAARFQSLHVTVGNRSELGAGSISEHFDRLPVNVRLTVGLFDPVEGQPAEIVMAPVRRRPRRLAVKALQDALPAVVWCPSSTMSGVMVSS